MRLLLDTHALLWFFIGHPNVSSHAREKIQDPNNRILVSIASLWEIAIKTSLGKLSLRDDFTAVLSQALDAASWTILPIEFEHVAELAQVARCPTRLG